MLSLGLAVKIWIIRARTVGKELNGLFVGLAFLFMTTVTMALLLLSRARDGVRLETKFVNPELNLVIEIRSIGRMYSVSVDTVFSSTLFVRTHVPCCQSERPIFPHRCFAPGAISTYPSATRLSLMPSVMVDPKFAAEDSPNTIIAPVEATEAAGRAAPAVPMAVAAAPSTDTTTPAILSAASSGPILHVHVSSVLLTIERLSKEAVHEDAKWREIVSLSSASLQSVRGEARTRISPAHYARTVYPVVGSVCPVTSMSVATTWEFHLLLSLHSLHSTESSHDKNKLVVQEPSSRNEDNRASIRCHMLLFLNTNKRLKLLLGYKPLRYSAQSSSSV
ncbi:hypothetical protein PsorP6_011395 [Peronosclerospora sorghi]|uniref:Uncharacterized protein n=1 Tax=Peronosclerospora sorghi TaxID=230839 RepID=A0ACC0WKU1_9STRA|nr:hypothetical protein PsorP6_011395 [Peronosclerospora sorghi]